MMKKVLALILAILMTASLTACGTSADNGTADSSTASNTTAATASTTASTGSDTATESNVETVTLQLGHANAVDTPADKYANMFADLVSEYSGGKITIEVYPASQLGTLQELQDAVELGTLDMCLGDSSMLSNVMGEYAILNLPMLITSYNQAEAVYASDEVAALVDTMASSHDMRQLCWWWNGFRHICTKTPIYSLDDCQGIKLRSPEADIYIKTFSLMGFNPTPIAWGDTYSAINTGVCDGADTTLEGIYDSDFYTMCPYVCLSSHMFSVIGLTINEDVWQGLSAGAQAVLMQAAEETTVAERTNAIASEQVYYDDMVKAGVTFTEFKDRDSVVEAFYDYWTETASACNANDLLDAIIAMA